MRAWVVGAALLYAVTTVRAEVKGVLMSYGVESCATFAEEYRKHPAQTEGLYFAWAQGYMSGLNVAAKRQGELARELNFDPTAAQMGRLRRYCDQHPLSNYLNGLEELYQSMPLIPNDTR